MHRTRFAPAPTGFLHLGHVANALYVWGGADRLGAGILLRIEDHDRQRCKPEYEAAMLEDLEWLGFEPDAELGPPLRQSAHPERYENAVEQLRALGHHVYACDCSRKDMAGVAGDVPDRETPYSGRCRHRGLTPGVGLGLRVVLPNRVELFKDFAQGPQTQNPAEQCGDLLLKDRLGNWTYQFCVVVDDLLQEIDLVIRGADLLDSTSRQIALARLLGRSTPPTFLHHPLIRKPTGEKLSKANRDTSIRDLRGEGATPEELFGRILAPLGASNSGPLSRVEAQGRLYTLLTIR